MLTPLYRPLDRYILLPGTFCSVLFGIHPLAGHHHTARIKRRTVARGGGNLPIYVVDRPLRVAEGEVGDDIRFVLNYPSSSRASHRAVVFRDKITM